MPSVLSLEKALSQHINHRFKWHLISNPKAPYVVWLTISWFLPTMKNKLNSYLIPTTMTFVEIRLRE